jgi:hypothetical protein
VLRGNGLKGIRILHTGEQPRWVKGTVRYGLSLKERVLLRTGVGLYNWNGLFIPGRTTFSAPWILRDERLVGIPGCGEWGIYRI